MSYPYGDSDLSAVPLSAPLSEEKLTSLWLRRVALGMTVSVVIGIILDVAVDIPTTDVIPLCLAVLLAGLSWRRYQERLWLILFIVGLVALLGGISLWVLAVLHAILPIPLPLNGGPTCVALALLINYFGLSYKERRFQPLRHEQDLRLSRYIWRTWPLVIIGCVVFALINAHAVTIAFATLSAWISYLGFTQDWANERGRRTATTDQIRSLFGYHSRTR